MSEKGIGIADIRRKIDAMDDEIHRLLMQRGELIDMLQRAKGVGEPGGTMAMRPAREAEMLRRLVADHAGDFPIASLERIWREIIGSFTQLQAPFRVLMTGADEAVLAEYGRHYFSVTTPISTVPDADAALAAIAEDAGVIGVIVDDDDHLTGSGRPWWATLALDRDHPARAVARYPFLKMRGSDAVPQRPALILSRAPVEPSGEDVTLAAVPIKPGLDDRAARTAIELAFVEAHLGGLSLRLADSFDGSDGGLALAEIAGHVPAHLFDGPNADGLRWLGGYAVPLELSPGARKAGR
ncbi:MAG: chorismate mutase [Hyphomicrobiales bacterium]|nr:chorismate mutase [Hyphomicrobiales bacterium]